MRDRCGDIFSGLQLMEGLYFSWFCIHRSNDLALLFILHTLQPMSQQLYFYLAASTSMHHGLLETSWGFRVGTFPRHGWHHSEAMARAKPQALILFFWMSYNSPIYIYIYS